MIEDYESRFIRTAKKWYGDMIKYPGLVQQAMDKIDGIAKNFSVNSDKVLCVVGDEGYVETAFFGNIRDITKDIVGPMAYSVCRAHINKGDKRFVIAIGRDFFQSGVVMNELKKDPSVENEVSVAVNVLNGLMIHELGHNEYSRKLIRIERPLSTDPDKIPDIFGIDKTNSASNTMVQVIRMIYYKVSQAGEDIFVNNRIRLSMPEHSEFLENLESLVFTRDTLSDAVAMAEKSYKEQKINQFLSLVVLMKMIVWSNDDLEEVLFASSIDKDVLDIFRMFYVLMDDITPEQRFDLFIDITKKVLLLEPVTSMVAKNLVNMTENGDGKGESNGVGKGNGKDKKDNDEEENGENRSGDLSKHVDKKDGELLDEANLKEQYQSSESLTDSGGKALTKSDYKAAIRDIYLDTKKMIKRIEEADREMKKAAEGKLSADMWKMIDDANTKSVTKLLPNGSELSPNEYRLLYPMLPCKEHYHEMFLDAVNGSEKLRKPYIAFAKELQRVRTHRETIEPSRRGRIVTTRLQRYKTGGLYKGIRKNYTIQDKDYEIMFLIDLSGSMWRELYFAATMHSYYMLMALKQVRGVDCHVYGHTTAATDLSRDVVDSKFHHRMINTANFAGNFRMRHGTVVYDIAHSGMSNKTIDYNYGTLLGSGRQIARGNRDGAAITLVSHKFKKNNAKKILFVMSDGAPTNYDWGTDGYQETAKSVNKARENGILVYSLSLVKSVIHTNNKIYGKKFNYDLRDMSLLPQIARDIMNN